MRHVEREAHLAASALAGGDELHGVAFHVDRTLESASPGEPFPTNRGDLCELFLGQRPRTMMLFHKPPPMLLFPWQRNTRQPCEVTYHQFAACPMQSPPSNKNMTAPRRHTTAFSRNVVTMNGSAHGRGAPLLQGRAPSTVRPFELATAAGRSGLTLGPGAAVRSRSRRDRLWQPCAPCPPFRAEL